MHGSKELDVLGWSACIEHEQFFIYSQIDMHQGYFILCYIQVIFAIKWCDEAPNTTDYNSVCSTSLTVFMKLTQQIAVDALTLVLHVHK